MNYRVVDLAGGLLCESIDLIGAELAMEWFRDRGLDCTLELELPWIGPITS